MRVLVLGGTEFTGPFVVRGLADAGHEVAVFHRGEHEHPLTRDARHLHGDFADLAAYVPELRAFEPEVVVDMCAFRREEGRRVLAFRGTAARAVVASSADVYLAYGRLHRTEPGEPVPLPLHEESPLRAVVIKEEYDKVGVELEARSDPLLPVTVLRLPAIHGPGDYLNRLHEYVRAMDERRDAIEIDRRLATWRWVRGYVEDVAHAICLAVTDGRAAGRTYNVCEPVAFSEEEWVRRVAAVHGWNGEISLVENEQLWDLRQDFVVDSTRIRAELGYAERVDPDEALRRTIQWERTHPPDSV
jgi:nucleoside-diphosphate-sugar epimerase